MKSEGAHKWYGFWVGVLKPVKAKIRGTKWNANHVVDDIFLGDVEDAYNLATMNELKITHVICCVMGLRAFHPSTLQYLCLPLRDIPEESIEEHFRSSIEFIDKALQEGGRVFVHCLEEHEMQVLTNHGFLSLREMEQHYDPESRRLRPGSSLRIACYDADGDELRYEASEELVVNEARQQTLIHFDRADADTSLLVTPGHDMWVRQGDGMCKRKAGDLTEAESIRFRALASRGFKSSSAFADLEYAAALGISSHEQNMAFLMWYGCWMAHEDAELVISGELDADFFDALGTDVVQCSASSFRVVHPDWVTYLSSACGIKSLHPWVFQLGRDEARTVLSGLSGGRGRVEVAAEEDRDQVVQLALHGGFRASAQRTGDAWTVSFDEHGEEPVLSGPSDTRRVAYEGRTWCVSVPTGLIVVRRAQADAVSRPVVCGNCMRGVSRSASIVLAWLIARKGLNVQESLDFLKSKRPIADPNEGFVLQLEDFYRIVHSGVSRRTSLPESMMPHEKLKKMDMEQRRQSVPTFRTSNQKNEDGPGSPRSANNDNNMDPTISSKPRSADGALQQSVLDPVHLIGHSPLSANASCTGGANVVQSTRDMPARLIRSLSFGEGEAEDDWVVVGSADDKDSAEFMGPVIRSVDQRSIPYPTGHTRYRGWLYKKGERRRAWKKRWVTIDSGSGWLYWWRSDGGALKGALPLSNATITTLAEQYHFRVTREGHSRDFYCKTEESFSDWLKYLADEISVQTKMKKKVLQDDKEQMSRLSSSLQPISGSDSTLEGSEHDL